MIARFGPNPTGRDFAVGDIHGCFERLERALQELAFDVNRDRLFAVGDLVDRGAHSAAALDWLSQPWFHSCMGNHDDMVCNASRSWDELLWWVEVNGGGWWLSLEEDMREAFQATFARLPLALEVETAGGRVGLVHADVPAELPWPAFVSALEAGDPTARHTALWGRQRADGLVTSPVKGIDRVVCGHTIANDLQVRVVGNVWLIDTGAFLPEGSLTVLALDALFDPQRMVR